ncbi:unnamed protein product [Cochlearia groenlandica]
MEEAKAEMEKKVSLLLKFIQNKNNIPKATKKELLVIVNNLNDHFHLLCSLSFQQRILDSRNVETKGKSCTNSTSSLSDLEYYSSEETDMINNKNNNSAAGEALSSDYYAVMVRKLQESDLRNEDYKRQVSNLKQETEFLRDQNMELAGDIGGKRREDKQQHLKGNFITKGEATLLLNQRKELEMEIDQKTKQVSETWMQLKRMEEETEERAKTELKIVEEKKDLWNKVQKLESQVIGQQKLAEEQKQTIDKLTEDQKLMKRWSFGSKPINTNLIEKKMEELPQDYKMKVEDHLRILYRRIHVAEQIHLESKNNTQENRENRGNRGDDDHVSERQFKKIQEMVEEGFVEPEKAIKKLQEGNELAQRVTKLANEVGSARKWVKEKKSETETLEAKLECREAQERLLKEKLSKLERKLGEEGKGKMSVEKAMRRIKKLEMEAKEKEYEMLSISEGKREAIRQLCVLLDYQRCRYDHLKTSICKLALQA